jgi:hypothetical protein
MRCCSTTEIKASVLNTYLVLRSVLLCVISDVREIEFSNNNPADKKLLRYVKVTSSETYLIPDRVVCFAHFKTINSSILTVVSVH